MATGSRRSLASLLRRPRRLIAVALCLTLAGTAAAVEVAGGWPWSKPDVVAADPVTGREGVVRERVANPLAAAAAPEVTWPSADRVELTATRASQTIDVGGLPVTITAAGGAAPQQVTVEVFDRAAYPSGVLLELTGETGASVQLGVGYGGFAGGYGGDYGSRLTLVGPDGSAVPAVNDAETKVVSAIVPARPTGTMLALAADEDSAQGDYAATALAPSSSWTAGGSAGAFAWSYPITTPPVPGGLAPSVGVSYSSQAVDGRTAVTNNQGSWIGEGFSFEPGYVERRYKPCRDDGHSGKGDLCWSWDNATIVLNGSANDLVKDGSVWRLESDDGSVVQRLTGAANGDDNGEYWQVTTADGTRLVFGRHQLPGWTSGKPVTNSAWTVPVFGDDSGEPCHGATFAASSCAQAWRWNLDHVIDRRGNVISYFYTKETNYYARNADTGVNGTAYTRGGYLSRVEYGQREGTIYSVPAPARVLFTVAERCLPSGGVTCTPSELDDDAAEHWPDVPWDLNCAADTPCEITQAAPSFWTRKRLTGITTEIRSGSGYAAVDSWALGHSFVSNADLSRSLWLESILRTGKAGSGSDIALPATTLLPVQRPNRVDEVGDNISPLIRPRLATVYTDAGGQIDVTYSDTDCAPGDTPSPASNTRRCYPVRWQPPGASDVITDWFHKYVVDAVTVSDRVGESPDQVTQYQYSGGAAWRHADPDGITDPDHLTWGQWRGYRTVTVVGAPNTTLASKTVYTYFRGMHGDDNGSGGTRSVSVPDSTGATHTDHDQLAGLPLEQIVYNNTAVVSKTITTHWRHVRATAPHSWADQHAVFVRPDTTTTLTALAAGGWRETEIDTDYDTGLGRVVETDDVGDTATAADDLCTRTEYADNTAAHMLAYPSRVETVAVTCSATPDRATDVVSDVRSFYDGGGFDQAPSAGLATRIQELAAHSGTTPTYVTVAETEYDVYGRVVSSTDAGGHETTTLYTDASGLTTGQAVTNPLGHVTETVLDPAHSQPIELLDVNDKRTSLGYDALGRLTGVWLPDRRKATGYSPNTKFSYVVTGDAPPAVRTETLKADAATYRASYDLFDGWLRPRQTQAPGPGGGRLVTDTVYDQLGRTSKINDPYYATGAPSGTLFIAADGEVNGQTVATYDRAGRPTAEIFRVAGQEAWRTTTSYGGDRVHTTPPDGGPPTTVISDARGRTVELRQYHGATPSGAYDATSYSYTPRGELAAVTDPAGNDWAYEYDQRGRKVETTDPDAGTTSHVYDDLDRLLSSTDARGVTVSYAYDALGRKTFTYEGQPGTGTVLAQWFWDNFDLGQLAGSRTFYDNIMITKTAPFRDHLYRAVRTQVHITGAAAGPLAGVYEYNTVYNTDNTVQSTTLPGAGGLSGVGLNYTYDALQRPTSVFDDVAFAADIEHYPTGELAQVGLFAGAKDAWQSFQYEPGSNRLARAYTSVVGVAGTVADVGYTYDDAGNVLSIIDDPGAAGGQRDAQCFGYDHLRRLTTAWTSAAGGAGPAACAGGPATTGVAGPAAYWQDYSFEVVGNRTTRVEHATGAPGSPAQDVTTTYSYPAPGGTQPHTLLAAVATDASGPVASVEYDYDPAGNTTGIDRDGTVDTFTWDALGRLDSVQRGGDVTEFGYDADGNRIIREDPSGMTLFLPGLEVHRPAGASSVTATRYLDLPGGISYVERTGGSPEYQISDHHGTAVMGLDPDTGAVTHRRMDPYGNPRGAPPATWTGERGFVGGTVDPTGLIHLGAREYDPTTGRFITVDPVMDLIDPQQIHGYAYAGNSPISRSDPTGLLAFIDGGASAGASRASNGTGMTETYVKHYTSLANGGGSSRNHPWQVVQELKAGWKAGLRNYLSDMWNGAWQFIANPRDSVQSMGNQVVSWNMRYSSVTPNGNPSYGIGAFCVMTGTCQIYEDMRAGNYYEAGYGGSQLAVDASVGIAAGAASGGAGTALTTAGRGLSAAARLANRLCSFSAGTAVLMADGAAKPIGDIKAGDEVAATDPQTGEHGPREVAEVWVHADELVQLQVDGGVITTTEDHPYWNATDRQWQRADALDPGDKLLTPDGQHVTVVGIVPGSAHNGWAYNLTVSDLHTYYVIAGTKQVLVHNTCDLLAAAERARDLAGLKPDGTPNRGSPVYVGGYDARGNVMGTGNGPQGSGIHAEDIIQEQMPGANMTEPYAWRRNKVTGELEWRPHTVCARCQGRYPSTLFPFGTRGESGGAWGG